MVFFNRYLDGSSQVRVMFSIEDSPEWPGGLVMWMDGPGLEGIEAYHNLPVRVWGEVTDTSGLLPILTIERFEPVYPGQKIQAWLGLMESVTVEGQQVLLFTMPRRARNLCWTPRSKAPVPTRCLVIQAIRWWSKGFCSLDNPWATIRWLPIMPLYPCLGQAI